MGVTDAEQLAAERTAQVCACLATVMDPELDESVVELGFITSIEVSGGGEVRLDFRLPTYWCAPNFAFLMADDMQRAVGALPWVTRVQLQLHDHMYAEAINQGVAKGLGFQAAFGAAAEGDLVALRRIFLLKAFQRRQEVLLQHLLDAGYPPAALVTWSIEALQQLPLTAVGKGLVERYLVRRALVGGPGLAFVDAEGQAISAAALPVYLRDARRVGINAEFNGALCRGLLAVREQVDEMQPVHWVRREDVGAR